MDFFFFEHIQALALITACSIVKIITGVQFVRVLDRKLIVAAFSPDISCQPQSPPPDDVSQRPFWMYNQPTCFEKHGMVAYIIFHSSVLHFFVFYVRIKTFSTCAEFPFCLSSSVLLPQPLGEKQQKQQLMFTDDFALRCALTALHMETSRSVIRPLFF